MKRLEKKDKLLLVVMLWTTGNVNDVNQTTNMAYPPLFWLLDRKTKKEEIL